MDKHIEKHGFIILKDFFDKSFERKLRFFEKKLIDKEYHKVINTWKGISGNNPNVRNINRRSFELYSLYYWDIYYNNEIDENTKENIKKSHYMYHENKNSIDCIFANDIKETYGKLMSWTIKYSYYIFKDFLKYILESYKKYDSLLIQSIKIHHLYPGCKEQEIHIDGPNTDNTSIMLIITIALNSIDKELNTIFYDRNMLNGYDKFVNVLKEDFEDYDLFSKAKVQEKAEIGVCSIHDPLCFHHGPANNTDKTRKFLFMEIQLFNK